MRLALCCLVAVVGCSPAVTSSAVQVQGPSAADQDRALQIAWGDAYGMGPESRPDITWMTGCTPDRIDVTVNQPVCWGSTVTPERGVELMWDDGDKISDTRFVNGLYAWKIYLTTGAFKSYDAADIAAISSANSSLITAGL